MTSAGGGLEWRQGRSLRGHFFWRLEGAGKEDNPRTRAGEEARREGCVRVWRRGEGGDGEGGRREGEAEGGDKDGGEDGDKNGGEKVRGEGDGEKGDD
ncbi:MAG: hypothetical protein MPL62_09895 [Alphaproteobacteria bacterium]|nr:hypothetical protein [Alphaproteobacteria bacterium]